MDNLRTGSTNRINPDRYFHVMNQGWYVFTREGVQGPYDQRNDAETLISSVIGDPETTSKKETNDNSKPVDTNDSWRM